MPPQGVHPFCDGDKMTHSPSQSRFWIVDNLRGVAIILMVYYHLTWDLVYFGVQKFDMLSGFWHYFAYGIASTFLFVMGVSLTISYNRVVQKTGNPHQFGRFFQRGLKIFGWGMLITVVTYFAFGDGYVVFGILHLIGASVIACYPFVRRKWLSLLAALIFFAIGYAVNLHRHGAAGRICWADCLSRRKPCFLPA